MTKKYLVRISFYTAATYDVHDLAFSCSEETGRKSTNPMARKKERATAPVIFRVVIVLTRASMARLVKGWHGLSAPVVSQLSAIALSINFRYKK